MTTIKTSLWFADEVEQATAFYAGLLPDSHIDHVLRDGDGNPVQVSFTLVGREFTAINGGGMDFAFNESVSLVVTTGTQEEADRYWEALTANGGEESQCGWLKDRYGLSWQIVPEPAMALLSDPDPEVAGKAMASLRGMRRIDSVEMERAARG